MAEARFPWCALLLALPLLFVGCLSIETIAPPAASARLGAPQVDLATLERGRKLYIGKCAKCHAPEPIHDYSREDWVHILIEMNEETNLTPAEGADVTAYVNAVLNMGPPPAS